MDMPKDMPMDVVSDSPCTHQLESYSWMCDQGIRTFVDSLNPWIDEQTGVSDFGGDPVRRTLNVTLREIRKPTIEPHEARLQDKNYTCAVVMKVHYAEGNTSETLDDVCVGNIPCLLRSERCVTSDATSTPLHECKHDEGGYFIIDGKEKVIVSRERIVPNQLFLNKETDDEGDPIVKGECRAVPLVDSLFPKVIRLSLQEVRTTRTSNATARFHRRRTSESAPPRRASVYDFRVSCAVGRMPLFILFRALAVESDKDILSHIFVHEEIHDPKYSMLIHDLVVGSKDHAGKMIHTRERAMDYAFPHERDDRYRERRLLNSVYPNVETAKEKAVMLGIHARKMIEKYFESKHVAAWSEKRDNFRQKRVDVCGVLLLQVFRDAFNKLRNAVVSKLKQDDGVGLRNAFDTKHIDRAMIASFKGNWGLLNDPSKSGIVEDLDRLSYSSYISHIRRVKSPVDSSLKLTDPHRLGTEQFGYFCPLESPDGANVGLIKHLASGCVVTTETPTDDLMEILRSDDENFIDMRLYSARRDSTKIFVNNSIVGQHDDPIGLYERMLKLRRSGRIHEHVTFYFHVHSDEFHVFTDSGRCLRPLFIAENIVKTREALREGRPLKHGEAFEFVELEESNHHLIARDHSTVTSYTRYCEIRPSLCLGYYMSTVPLVNHNPSQRAMFAGQQAKQAIGVYATSFRERFDNVGYVLNYPQKNLITTRDSAAIQKDAIPNGENVIIAIAAMGYNQEDAVILNKNSVERGMFNVSAYKTLTASLSSSDASRTSFANLKHEKQNGLYLDVDYKNDGDEVGYDRLDAYGFPKRNEKFDDGDVLVGKITTKYADETSMDSATAKSVRDTPVRATGKHNGHVDDLYLFDSGSKLKVRLRQMRVPTLGDKLGSMHGQKGVVGMVLPQEDMPFNKDGLVPDVVINPYAFPKRMTIGHVLECVFGRAAATAGNQMDASAFQRYDLDHIADYLENKNMHRHSNELLYNPRTGHQLNAEIFIGPMYYYRLKHMVKDKVNYRGAVGGVDAITGQPAQGKARRGGLKIGEMEMNSIVAHGTSTFLKEAMVDKSDGVVRQPGKSENTATHHAFVDSEGDTVVSNYDRKMVLTDGVTPDVSAVRLPKSFQLMQQELRSACVNMRLKTDQDHTREAYWDEDLFGLTEEEHG